MNCPKFGVFIITDDDEHDMCCGDMLFIFTLAYMIVDMEVVT